MNAGGHEASLERFRMYAQFGNKQQQQVRTADEKNVVWIFR